MATSEILRFYLTPQRRDLLELIRDWQRERGYGPSVRELQAQMGLAAPSTVHHHLAILRDQGAIDWIDGQARTFHLTKAGRNALVL